MTQPTITYRQGFLCDCTVNNSTSILTIDVTKLCYKSAGWTAVTCDWAETEDGQTITSTGDGDTYTIQCTVSAGNKIGYISWPDEAEADEIEVSTDSFPYMTFRYKTDTTAKAKIVAVFHGGGTQTVLAQTTSTSWTTATVALTAGQVLDHIRLHCDAATGYVYYDFIMLHLGVFTWPFSPRTIVERYKHRYGGIGVWGRTGNIPQYGGEDDGQIALTGIIDEDTSWQGTYSKHDEYLKRIHHETATYNPWQWFTSDGYTGKVRPIELIITRTGDDEVGIVQYTWNFLEYHTINNYAMSYQTRFYDE